MLCNKLNKVGSTLYNVQYTLYIVRRIIHEVYYTLGNYVQCTIYDEHYTL